MFTMLNSRTVETKLKVAVADVCQEEPLFRRCGVLGLAPSNPRVSARLRRAAAQPTKAGSTNPGTALQDQTTTTPTRPDSRLAADGQSVSCLTSVMDNHSLHSKASQATLVSLLELDPTPMDSPNPDKDVPQLTEQTDGSVSDSTPSLKTSSTASSLGLSGSGHGPIYYCTSPSLTFSLPTKQPKTNPVSCLK